jgi:hypothetical protein
VLKEKIMSKNKAFIGTIELSYKGKIYGATTRRINAKNKNDAERILKKRFDWEDERGNHNIVRVTKLDTLADYCLKYKTSKNCMSGKK